jgi:hypothetical protein
MEVLIWALPTKTAAFVGPEGAPVRDLAGQFAERIGVRWCKTTAESMHERISSFPWDRLSKAAMFRSDELDPYPRERLRFLEIVRAAKHAKDRGKDLKQWCRVRARADFNVDTLPARASD